MRKHYIADWGRPIPEGAEGKTNFEVTVDFTIRTSGTEIVEVEAWCEDEATELAEEKTAQLHDAHWADDFEIKDTRCRKLPDSEELH